MPPHPTISIVDVVPDGSRLVVSKGVGGVRVCVERYLGDGESKSVHVDLDREQVSALAEFLEADSSEAEPEVVDQGRQDSYSDKGIPIARTVLSGRAKNMLESYSFTTLEQVSRITQSELARMRNCGNATMLEIVQVLSSFDLSLHEPDVLLGKSESEP